MFSVLYVGADGVLNQVGTINDTAININESSFYWPDGTQGIEWVVYLFLTN